MKTIYKYAIASEKENTIYLPEDFLIVLVGDQRGAINIWVELDTDKSLIPYSFVVHGTGDKIDDDEEHLGSVVMEPYVWHVYYKCGEILK